MCSRYLPSLLGSGTCRSASVQTQSLETSLCVRLFGHVCCPFGQVEHRAYLDTRLCCRHSRIANIGERQLAYVLQQWIAHCLFLRMGNHVLLLGNARLGKANLETRVNTFELPRSRDMTEQDRSPARTAPRWADSQVGARTSRDMKTDPG